MGDLWGSYVTASPLEFTWGGGTLDEEFDLGRSTSHPGALTRAFAWQYNHSLWLYGGLTDPNTPYNQVWTYNLGWTLVSGDIGPRGAGDANTPGARYDCGYATTPSGLLYIFGGFSRTNLLGDLWKFTPGTQSWSRVAQVDPNTHYVYPTNPGARANATIWADDSGVVWLFGGITLAPSTNLRVHLSDLWKFSAGSWAWQFGTQDAGLPAVYPLTSGDEQTDTSSTPGARFGSASWKEGSDLFLFGGATIDRPLPFNDLWKFDTTLTQWWFMTGIRDTISAYTPSVPSGVYGAGYFYDPATKTAWIYGGLNFKAEITSDVYSYSVTTNNWTAVDTGAKTDSVFYPPTPGTSIIPIQPPSSPFSAMWVDNGKISLFIASKADFEANSDLSPDASLWLYDSTTGVWIYGGATQNSNDIKDLIYYSFWHVGENIFVFGGQLRDGTADSGIMYQCPIIGNTCSWEIAREVVAKRATNRTPPPRFASAYWYEPESKNLMFFGGRMTQSGLGSDSLASDLWTFNLESLNYNPLQEPDLNIPIGGDSPASRYFSAGTSNTSFVWIHGGRSMTGGNNSKEIVLQDLWQFDQSLGTWELLSDGDRVYPDATGGGGANCNPGPRYVHSIIHIDGVIWLYGGLGNGHDFQDPLGDVWVFDLTTRAWLWIAGPKDDITVRLRDGTSGPKGFPPGRGSYSVFFEPPKQIWIFGGESSSSNGESTYLNDLWLMTYEGAPAVVNTSTTTTIPTTGSGTTNGSTTGSTTGSATTGAAVPKCGTNNGGCDWHVVCEDTASGPFCPPCPTGFNGSSIGKCTPLCGDQFCDASIFETCVSCPLDCLNVTCNLCGDGKCDSFEDCTSCYEDCHSNCVLAKCLADCSGNGQCIEGVCECSGNWNGPACNVSNAQSKLLSASSDPVVGLSTANSLYQISIPSVEEKDKTGKVVESRSLVGNFTKTQSSVSNSDIYNFNKILENLANVTITIQHFTDVGSVFFANKTTQYAANSVKLTISVSNWPFKSLDNSLTFIINTGNPAQQTQTCNVQTNTDYAGDLNWYTLTFNGVTMYGTFTSQCVIDGRNRGVQFKLEDDNSVSATVPHFWDTMQLDPSFSVLLGQTYDPCSHKSLKSSVPKTILIAVLVPVGVLLILGVLAYFLVPRFFLQRQVRKEKGVMMERVSSSPQYQDQERW